MQNIGKRLKYFRLRSGKSQMNLELETDCAFGSISRFESGKVHPTKETIEYLAQALKLTDMELDYLTGSVSIPASSREIELAINEVKPFLNERGILAYLIDERWRFHAYSKTFAKILGFDEKTESAAATKALDSTLIEMMLLPELKVCEFLTNDESDYNLRTMLKCYYQEVGYMIDDPYFIRTVKAINSNPKAAKIWNDLETEKPAIALSTINDRRIFFRLAGNFKICLNFTNQCLHNYHRFKFVEYIPNSKLMKLIAKLV